MLYYAFGVLHRRAGRGGVWIWRNRRQRRRHRQDPVRGGRWWRSSSAGVMGLARPRQPMSSADS